MIKKLILLSLLLGACTRSASEDPLVLIQIQDRNGVSETISIPERLEAFNGVDFLTTQPYKKILRVYKKEGKNHSVITTYHPNGLVWQYLEAQDMRAFGRYQEWFSNGHLKIEAHVIGGTADVAFGSQSDWLFDGISQVWDEQGCLIAEIPYTNGSLEGVSIHYYPSGQIQDTIPYQHNLIEGDAFEYFPDGKMKGKTSYRKGIKQGLATGYWDNESPSRMEDFTDGRLNSGSYFTLTGERVSSVENGFGHQTVFEGPALYQQIEIRNGKQEGKVKVYAPNGELRTTFQIKNGKKQGEEIEYYAPFELENPSQSPSPKISLYWDDNALHGLVKTWYSNGLLESQKELVRNKKTGSSCGWYRDGNLMLIEEYEEDHLVKGQYYKKGQKEPVSSVLNGNGVATLYDSQGIILRKAIYYKGKPLDPED